jgi:Putative MetA-pathway of phenol degradation
MRFQTLCVLYVVLLFSRITPALAQQTPGNTEPSCGSTAVISVFSRPTVANATDVTQCGTVEVEYGLERQWPGYGAHRDDLAGGLRVGLTQNLDFHWSSATFLHVMDGTGDRTGFGDTWLALKYRLLRQTRRRPSLGWYYAAKVPSASADLGLGSGKVDHSLSLLLSKDFRRIHVDFNFIQQFTGRIATSGFDRNNGFALSTVTPLTHRLNLIAEAYGYTILNQGTPAFASAMAGCNYQVQPRLYLDGGFDFGITSAAPNQRVFVGVTYAMGNFRSRDRDTR